MSAHSHSPLPMPAPGHRSLVGAAIVFAVGLAILAYALIGAGASADAAPDRIVRVTAPPVAQPADLPAPVAKRPRTLAPTPVVKAKGAATAKAAAHPHSLNIPMFSGPTSVSAAWAAGFYPIYAEASKTFAVNPLLIASVHKQESGFSTAASTYHGVNFARCCAGPMQFNVTNGPQTTWDRFAGAYRRGHRPSVYNHVSHKHPSVYDDFDAIMAGASLLRASGAGMALDGTAWQAAYDYYGHDATGIAYADEVVARARGWAAHGFCVNCGVDQKLIDRTYADYGAFAMNALAPPPAPAKHSRHVR